MTKGIKGLNAFHFLKDSVQIWVRHFDICAQDITPTCLEVKTFLLDFFLSKKVNSLFCILGFFK